MTRPSEEAEEQSIFWVAAEPLLGRDDITRSTLTGLPCLRVDGQFFAALNPSTGEVFVKLPAVRVEQLATKGQAHRVEAAPDRRAGHWVALRPTCPDGLGGLLGEALDFVGEEAC